MGFFSIQDQTEFLDPPVHKPPSSPVTHGRPCRDRLPDVPTVAYVVVRVHQYGVHIGEDGAPEGGAFAAGADQGAAVVSQAEGWEGRGGRGGDF